MALPVSRLLILLAMAGVAGAQSAGPLIVLIGPPVSGKTTQAQILQKQRGMAVISVEDLIAQNREAFEKIRRPQIQGVGPRLDPIVNRLIDERLRSIDRSKGVILDGYPASKDQGDHLTALIAEFQFAKPIVLQLRVSDDEVRKRGRNRGRQDIEQELKDYHREFDFAQTYFPQASIHAIDASRPPQEVAKEIRKVLGDVK
jgi:adenylate kinase